MLEYRLLFGSFEYIEKFNEFKLDCYDIKILLFILEMYFNY